MKEKHRQAWCGRVYQMLDAQSHPNTHAKVSIRREEFFFFLLMKHETDG